MPCPTPAGFDSCSAARHDVITTCAVASPSKLAAARCRISMVWLRHTLDRRSGFSTADEPSAARTLALAAWSLTVWCLVIMYGSVVSGQTVRVESLTSLPDTHTTLQHTSTPIPTLPFPYQDTRNTPSRHSYRVPTCMGRVRNTNRITVRGRTENAQTALLAQ